MTTIEELTRKALQGDLAALQELRDRGVLGEVHKEEKETGTNTFPLSHAQFRLWLLDRMEGGSIAYNMPGAFLLEGNLVKTAFRQAFLELVNRHESLRTAFVLQDGNPRQKILPFDPKVCENRIFHFIDLHDNPDPEKTAREIAREDSITPFDLEQGYLLRITLLDLPPKTEPSPLSRYILLFNMHHIISDGWSIGVMIREFRKLYEAFSRGQRNPLPPLRIQYRDYVVWQKQQVESESFEVHRQYWLKKLSGEIPVLDLPTDYKRPPMHTFNGGVLRIDLGSELTGRLKILSHLNGVTLFMSVVAAVKALLHRYTGQEDIIVGIPIAGREHPDLENQIGFYVNTLVLRDAVHGDELFSTLLKRVGKTAGEAYEHQQYPFDRLVDEVNIKRDISRSPLFDVMIVMQNPDARSFEIKGMEVSPFSFETQTSKFDLTFNFEEKKGALVLDIEYCSDLFSRDRIERMAQHFLHLVENLVTGEDQTIGETNILPENEKNKILFQFMGPAVQFPRDKTVHGFFEDQANRFPENPAVICDEKELNYRELNREANRLSHFITKSLSFAKTPFKPDDCVAVVLDRSEWLVISMLGIMKAGGAYMPIDPVYPEERIAYMLSDSGCKAVITETKYMESLQNLDPGVPLLDVQTLTESETDNPVSIAKPDNLSYVIYTSGSTGDPKGVMIEHTGFINMILHHNKTLELDCDGRMLQFASCSFDASMIEVFMALLCGACLVMVKQEVYEDPEKLVELIENKKVTHAILPPSLLKVIGFECLRSLEMILTAGEAAVSDGGVFTDENHRYWNAYGPTEASVSVSNYRIRAEDEKGTSIPIGKPIANTEILILNPSKKHIQPISVPGEMGLAGAGLARGYLNKPELTAKKFVPHPFRKNERMYLTGDLAYYRPDGNIVFIGRNDYQVKIRGYRIELGDIENHLVSLESVHEAAVLVKTLDNGDKELIAYVTGPEKLNAGELMEKLKTSLPGYMIPSLFYQLDKMPLTRSGKIDRNALAKEKNVRPQLSSDFIAPGTDVEKQIANVWKETLQIEEVGIEDNFFELGGNSLFIVRIQARLEEIFSRRLSLVDMFKYPTISALARFITEPDTGDGQEAAQRAQTRTGRTDTIKEQREKRIKRRRSR